MRTREQIAIDVLKCALSWDPIACVIGNVTALEVAELAASVVDTCPKCGSTAWVNIDCGLCRVGHELRHPGEGPRTDSAPHTKDGGR